ncbi:protein kinase, partial [Prosthecobacter sp.]|uniref:protein kinase domain-containing protein n=1 Tax=Prosthecobacter sp. TaxID=1965333 RepID=UPI001DF51095
MSTDPSTPENDANLSALGRELLGTNEGSKPSGPWVPPTAEELHKLLPEYEIVKMLGRGGMGAVYMGKQISLDRQVAIKILSNALEEADASFAERFKNEAKAMGKLSHPGIVAVHDFGETEGGLLYIVMEYVEGTDVA